MSRDQGCCRTWVHPLQMQQPCAWGALEFDTRAFQNFPPLPTSLSGKEPGRREGSGCPLHPSHHISLTAADPACGWGGLWGLAGLGSGLQLRKILLPPISLPFPNWDCHQKMASGPRLTPFILSNCPVSSLGQPSAGVCPVGKEPECHTGVLKTPASVTLESTVGGGPQPKSTDVGTIYKR